MTKSSLIEELDQAVDQILRQPDGRLPQVDARIEPLMRIAAALRDLPSNEFRGRLKTELVCPEPEIGQTLTARSGATASGLDESLVTDEQNNRLTELAGGTELEPKSLRAALEGLTEMSMRVLASVDQCTVGVSRLSDPRPRWEQHRDGDALLHVLEGEMAVTTLTNAGAVHTTVPRGSIFVCPAGLWHWPRPKPTASVLFVKPAGGTEHSRARKPGARARAGRPARQGPRTSGSLNKVSALDVRAALSGKPMLVISASTTEEEAGAAFPQLGMLNQSGLFVGRFSGLSPWECHTGGDELLHVLEGEVEITTLTDAGPVRNTLGADSVFVCPRGLWHRQYSAGGALIFSATPLPSEVSFAEDPRV